MSLRLKAPGGVELRFSLWLLPMLPLAAWLGWMPMLAAWLPALLMHDWAHVLMASVCGVRVRSLSISPLGAAVELEEALEYRPWDLFWVYMAGPGVSLLLAMSVSLLWHFYPALPLESFFKANLALAAVNLLPALPLDGGRMLRAFLSRAMELKKAFLCAQIVGLLIGAALLGLGVMSLVARAPNPTLLVMGAFLMLSAWRLRASSTYSMLRALSVKQDKMHTGRAVEVRQVAVSERARLSDIYKAFRPQQYQMLVVLDEQARSLGTLSEQEFLRAIVDLGAGATAGRALRHMQSLRAQDAKDIGGELATLRAKG